MAKNKRSKIELVRDRVIAQRLYFEGFSQPDIVAALNGRAGIHYSLTTQQISYDLRAIHKAWLSASILDHHYYLMRELERIDNLEREHWEAWRHSLEKEAGERATRHFAMGDDGEGNVPQATSGTTFHEEPLGAIAHLDGVKWCIDYRLKLLDLIGPMKIAFTNPAGDKEATGITLGAAVITVDDRARLIADTLVSVQRAAIAAEALGADQGLPPPYAESDVIDGEIIEATGRGDSGS